MNLSMKKTLAIITSMFLCIGCDQFTKAQASSLLKGKASLSYMENTFRLHYTENSGVMLGAGSQLPEEFRFYIFTIGVGLFLFAALCFLIIKPVANATVLFGSLLVSGGLGNWYDRAVNDGAVVDFMNFGIGGLRTGIFNIADVTIMVGAIGLLIYSSNDNMNVKNRTQNKLSNPKTSKDEMLNDT
jgi:signal peptidase II